MNYYTSVGSTGGDYGGLSLEAKTVKRTKRTHRRWGFWKLIRLAFLWHVLPDRYKAGTLRAILYSVDAERMEARQRLIDTAADWCDGFDHETIGEQTSALMCAAERYAELMRLVGTVKVRLPPLEPGAYVHVLVPKPGGHVQQPLAPGVIRWDKMEDPEDGT